MTDWENYRQANQANWDDRVYVHVRDKSGAYDVDAFLQGENTLHDIEQRTLGDVRGKRLLHLMCHFGMDTLSWARLGADVTGVDFSPEAIAQANALKKETGLEALFVESDIYDLPAHLDLAYDIVIASYGTLCWLPDAAGLFRVAYHFLKRGGTFLLINDHPFKDVLNYDAESGRLDLSEPYFHRGEPQRFDSPRSYIEHREPILSTVSYEWTHDMGTILGGLLQSGLELVALREYPFSFYKAFPNMVEGERGEWFLPGVELPLMLELECRRPARA